MKKHVKKLLSKIFNKKVFKFFIKWGFVLFIWLFICGIIICIYYGKDLPDIDFQKETNKDVNIEILYSNNEPIKLYGSANSDITNYAELPLYLVDGLVATEDRRFFSHHGFDVFGILRAMITNIRAGYIKQGGSTITQQLSKMLLQNSQKTLKRKVQELLLSIYLEMKFTKEEILMMYLNKAYFGAGKYGIKSASKFYFNKEVYELDLEESAMIVGLLKAPSKYSPQNNPVLSKERTRQILKNMYDAGFISAEEYNKYVNDFLYDIVEATTNTTENMNEELYFGDYVRNRVTDYTNKTNLRVTTTLNQKIQTSIENSIIEFINTNKNKLGKAQIAVVAMSNDGAILGMTGGINYNKSEFNRAVYAYRQPGSAFKLFVFLTGIREKGFTPYTKFKDEPVAVGNWFPDNYAGKYYGEVDMKTAFAKSLNSVAIQVSEYSGLNNVAKLAQQMGIKSKIDKDDPTIALGTTELSLLELVSAYSVVINDGYVVIPYSITKIVDEDTNNIVYYRTSSGKSKILDDLDIDYIKEMMYETILSGTGKNAYIYEVMNKGYKYVGGKTGTSQNYADAWFIGYVGDMVIGVWIGNDDNTSMNKTTGGTLPTILWRNIVERII